MSNINFICPHCSFSKQLPASVAGQQGKCPSCGSVVTISGTVLANPSISPQQPLGQQPLGQQPLDNNLWDNNLWDNNLWDNNLWDNNLWDNNLWGNNLWGNNTRDKILKPKLDQVSKRS